jgi:hypothetical protein
MILKFADRTEEVTDELMLIDRHVQQINVAQDIFDFIFLEIPIKRLHPKFVEEEVEGFDEEDEDDEDWDDDDLLWEDEEGEFVYTTGGGDDDDEDEEEYEEKRRKKVQKTTQKRQ